MAKLSKKKRREGGDSGAVELAATSAVLSAPSQDAVPAKPKKARAKLKRLSAGRLVGKREGKASQTASVPVVEIEADRLVRLQIALQAARTGVLGSVRTHKLLGSGVPKMAQKLVEEAAETAIEAVRDQRDTLIQESADLLFNLAVLWQALDVKPGDIWAEMDRRETLFGLAEKLPKPDEPS